MQALSRKSDLLKSVVNLRQSFFVLCGCLVLFGSLANVNALDLGSSGSIQLIVTNQNEVPIPQANVCFVLSNLTIGGRQTDSSGRFNADLPPGTVTVHISKQGFLNSQQAFNITTGGNLVHQFRLQPGTSTASPAGCGAIIGTTTTGGDSLTITGFHVVGGTTTTNPRVTFRATFDTYPRAYRIREFTAEERYPFSSFDPERAFQRYNVPWQPMPLHMAGTPNTLQLEFNLNPDALGPGYGEFGTHTIYLQVAKVAFYDPSTSALVAGGASNTKGLSVVLAPAQLKTYTLTGSALQTFIQQARDRGYTFQTTEDKVLGKFCLTNAMVVLPVWKDRILDEAVEIIRGRFEVFIGPDLKPFWKLKSIDAEHTDFYPLISPSTSSPRPALVITKEVTGSGGPNSIRRVFQWRRTVWPSLSWGQMQGWPVPTRFVPTDVHCRTLSQDGASLTHVTLEGPSGKNPIDALPRPW